MLVDIRIVFKRGEVMKKTKKEISEMIENQLLDVDFVSAIAGDRELTGEEQKQFDNLIKRKGDLVYSDLIYSLSYKRFAAKKAVDFWSEIIEHKKNLSKILKRNPGVVVATLDYLQNIYGSIEQPVVIPEKKIDDILNIAVKDSLTDLFDKTVFEFTLNYEVLQHKRRNSTFAMMIIDIDDFKKVNDHYGHQKGDYVLKIVASLIKKNTRETDTISRYGGDEFAVLLPETSSEGAAKIGNRLLRDVKETLKDFSITISIGVSDSGVDDKTISTSMIIEKTDSALYISKKNGKGLLTVYQ